MNSDLIICGLDEVVDILARRKIDAVISINNPKINVCHQTNTFNGGVCKDVIVHSFYFKDYRKYRPTHGKGLPDIEDIIRMKQLVAVLTNKTVIFHCKAGISRSSAFVYIMLRELKMSKRQALTHINDIRAIARPNPRIIHMYEELYGSDLDGEISNPGIEKERHIAGSTP
jgi:predicted protein tyrosine phosphatase